MKTKDKVIQAIAGLCGEIQNAKNIKLTRAQALALLFAEGIARVSPTVFLLTENGAATEAFTIGRLLLEHYFNFSALLHKEKHYETLYEHALGEPGRQLKKIMQNEEKFPVLTPEHTDWTTEYLSHPEREHDPKTGLNWEQIANSGEPAGLYTTYKTYSFIYAHSTFASIRTKASEKDIEGLHDVVWRIVELSRLQLREKLIKPANQPKP